MQKNMAYGFAAIFLTLLLFVAPGTAHAQDITIIPQGLTDDPFAPIAGNPLGDVTIVEFFDYNCPVCRGFRPTLDALITQDKNVRVMFKELPVLAPDSVIATKAALAVNALDKKKYFAYQGALFASQGKFTTEMVVAKAQALGIDPAALKKAMENPDLDEMIAHNSEMAQTINIGGVPAIILNDELVRDDSSLEGLQAKVAAVRLQNKLQNKGKKT